MVVKIEQEVRDKKEQLVLLCKGTREVFKEPTLQECWMLGALQALGWVFEDKQLVEVFESTVQGYTTLLKKEGIEVRRKKSKVGLV